MYTKKQWAKAYKTCMGRWDLTLPAQLCDCVRVAISALYREFITNTCIDTQMNPGIRNNAGVPAKQGGYPSPPPGGEVDSLATSIHKTSRYFGVYLPPGKLLHARHPGQLLKKNIYRETHATTSIGSKPLTNPEGQHWSARTTSNATLDKSPGGDNFPSRRYPRELALAESASTKSYLLWETNFPGANIPG